MIENQRLQVGVSSHKEQEILTPLFELSLGKDNVDFVKVNRVYCGAVEIVVYLNDPVISPFSDNAFYSERDARFSRCSFESGNEIHLVDVSE